MTGRCTQGKRFDIRGAFDGVWVHGKSPVLGIGDTESLEDRIARKKENLKVEVELKEEVEAEAPQGEEAKNERNG